MAIEFCTEEEVNETQAEEMFDEMLDDTSSEIEIGGCSYPYSDALKRMDPVAYRCAFVDWASEMELPGYC